MITAAVILFVSPVLAAWLVIRREQSTPTLGEAYRDENLNQHSDPL
jgi:hypothetical protein